RRVAWSWRSRTHASAKTAFSSWRIAASFPSQPWINSRTSPFPPRNLPGKSSASGRASPCFPFPPRAAPSTAPRKKSAPPRPWPARRPRTGVSKRTSTANCKWTPRSSPRSRRANCRKARWPAARLFLFFPTSTRATSPASSSSTSPAPMPTARFCWVSTARQPMSPAAPARMIFWASPPSWACSPSNTTNFTPAPAAICPATSPHFRPGLYPMNTVTPRVFIAATRQNDGKTTTSLGLIAALRSYYPRIGYIKPVGQRFVEIEEQKIDEYTVLMDSVFRLNCPLVDMSPIAVEPDFTRKYLESANNDALVRKIQKAFDRVAWEKDFVLCEGSGHAGVGSVFDLSNAQVAKIVGAKVIIVTQGGIGRPIDEVSLNQALFEKEG